jgi:hypothetical protein
MRRAYVASLIALFAFAALVARADDFWAKKDWQKWSPADCKKMLTDSPWSHTFGMVHENLSAALRSSNKNVNSTGNDNMEESNVLLNYYVEFHSAPPVREATVRELALQQKYDSMPSDKRKQFDQQAAAYISRDFKDYILVHVQYECNVGQIAQSLANIWQSYPEDKVPVDTYLDVESGQHIPPLKFISGHGGDLSFDLYFPRTISGEPVIKPTDKEVSVEFPHPNVTDFPAQRVFVAFKLDKMTEDGKLIY